MVRHLFKSFIFVLSIIFLSACGGGGGGGDSTPVTAPTPAPTPEPGPTQLDLDGGFAYTMGDGKYTQSLIISREGEILGSDFRGITDNEIANLPSNVRTLGTLFITRDEDDFVTSQSVGKSVTSLLIGIAIENGSINSIDQPASDFITEWQNDGRSTIRIRDLLNMRSGLESFGGSSILDLISLEDSTTTCINRQLRGDNSFAYLNCDTQVLGEIIERASGTDLKTFADENFFLSLGVQAYWWQDPTGNYISYAGVDLKPDEYLRLGQLFLDPNQNIVPSDYLNQIYSGYGTPEASDSYSLGFWYFYDHFQMRGLDGQIVAINFDDEIVIARNSLYLAPSGERIGDLEQTIPVAPVTLPEAVGGSGVWDFEDFLDVLYISAE